MIVFYKSYLTSSKTTLTDYQCVSTGCCTHVAKTEITIDNQHVTKSLQRYRFLPKQPKENIEKITNLMISFDSDCLLQVCLSYICFSPVLYYVDVPELFSELSLLPYGWELLQRTSNCSRSFQKIFQIHIIYNNKHEYCHLFIKRLAF